MEGLLYQEVCKVENLFSAWCKVKEKDSAGGIDRVTIDAFAAHLKQNLEALAEELRLYRYIPEPYYEVKIPKGGGEFRSLSLPTVRDKIVQQAVKDLIEPMLERVSGCQLRL
jgi:retron-type reverse transcriptase